jgi:hypothetical protein
MSVLLHGYVDALPQGIPLNARKDRGDVVRWRPPVLQDIKTQLSGTVYVGVKHGADELHARRLVWVCFLKVHDKAEGPVFEGCVCGADDYCVPADY